jgi:O-antigen biosynthesis protein
MKESITFSIVIVNYNVREFLDQACKSVISALRGHSYEIWVVDNASSDGSVDFIQSHFPQVRLLVNRTNVGFAQANNQALAQCQGRYICLLNPDTIVEEKTFTVLQSFLEQHPEAGAVSCKVLNPDGSLQLACRRSFPTPWVAFSKIAGLAALFPKSRLFGRYNLTYLDPERIAEVEAISGSFMLIRRTVLEQVGFLDDTFFMYGEDLDYCYRIRANGWKIFYVPETRIIHFKGESSKKSPFEQRSLFYQAMRLFVRKHMHASQALIPLWLLLIAIRLRALLSFISAIVSAALLPFIDVTLMTLSLSLAVYWRFAPRFPWQDFLIVHAVYSAIWLMLLSRHGLYRRNPFSFLSAGSAVILGWMVNSAVTFFFKDIGFSRLVVIYAGLLNLMVIPGWRLAFKVIAHINYHYLHGQWGGHYLLPQTLLVMDSDGSYELLAKLRLRLEKMCALSGIVLVDEQPGVREIKGLPVLGTLAQIDELIRQKKIQQVIFATEQVANFKILSIISGRHERPVVFKWIPRAMDVIIGKSSVEYVEELPLLEIDDRLHEPANRRRKRMLDISVAASLLVLSAPVLLWRRMMKNDFAQDHLYLGLQGRPLKIKSYSALRSVWAGYLSSMLWLILKGEMSLVGSHLTPLQEAERRAPLIKPGWTGLEQLQEGNEMDDGERERLQLYYMKNYSILLDIEIIFQTLMKKIKR